MHVAEHGNVGDQEYKPAKLHGLFTIGYWENRASAIPERQGDPGRDAAIARRVRERSVGPQIDRGATGMPSQSQCRSIDIRNPNNSGRRLADNPEHERPVTWSRDCWSDERKPAIVNSPHAYSGARTSRRVSVANHHPGNDLLPRAVNNGGRNRENIAWLLSR